MWLSKLKDEDITPEIVQKLVFDGVEDRTGEKGDCILVLGGSSPFVDRVPKAVELYKAGLAPKIVMSGGPVWDTPYGRMSEADAMAACAMELGVPEEDIIRDNLARTTIENMICGALAIGRELKFPNVKKVLLVTTYSHMSRSKKLADLFLPPYLECICCPAYGYIDRENWQDGGDRERRVIREVIEDRKMVERGYIDDIEL